MNFKQAREKIKEIAKGRGYFLEYGIQGFKCGDIEQECSLWIEEGDGIMVYEPTWKEAFAKLDEEIKKKEGTSPN